MLNPLKLTELVLRDAHQSLLATRLRIEDMLPIAAKLDAVGLWSLETWGGATFDACIRYLGEDPWERLRQLKRAMPKTPQQMLLRGQNLLRYRHYADDVVEAFVDRAAENGVDVFRIFDALNDLRNLTTAVKAALRACKRAQGTISYTVSPVDTIDLYVDMGKRLEDLGCHSICIKDMAGLLKPYVAFELVSRLKATCSVPIAMQSHATTGMSTVTNIKAAEAGIDMLDTATSSMSMTYGHSATESVVAILQGTNRDTGLDLKLLDEIASYFRGVRRKYAEFEGSLKGVDARILLAQVPGGMLTNMEKQLRDPGAAASFDAVASAPAAFRVRVWQITSGGRGPPGRRRPPQRANVAYAPSAHLSSIRRSAKGTLGFPGPPAGRRRGRRGFNVSYARDEIRHTDKRYEHCPLESMCSHQV